MKEVNSVTLPKTLRELLTLPTAAFVEREVMNYLTGVCGKLPHTTTRFDEWGNLVVRYRNTPPKGHRAVVFTAHTDHPGFCSLKMLGKGRLLAAFRGWVEPEYFLGTRVKFWSGGKWVPGTVRKITKSAKIYRHIGRTARPEEVEIAITGDVEANAPGMWDLPDPELRDGLVRARGCDDIAGAAALLEMLIRIAKKRAKGEVWGLFTRAEEVGFIGAIGAAKSGTIPRKLPIVAIETSKALVNAKIGDGPILRVGDKASVFTPDLTAFCYEVGQNLAEKKKGFKFQRKLMDGGTCESTAYYAYGYEATGMCVALGNYHNMNAETKKIDSEYISIDDWHHMVDWFEAIALAKPGYTGGTASMVKGLDKRFAEHRRLLEPRS